MPDVPARHEREDRGFILHVGHGQVLVGADRVDDRCDLGGGDLTVVPRRFSDRTGT